MRIRSSDPLFLRINAKLDRIAQEISRGEVFLADLDRSADLEARERLDIKGRLASLSAHNVYNGIEQVFEDIAVEIDGGRPAGEANHAALLDQMSVPSPNRPALINPEQRAALDDLRRFRHVVRHSDGLDLRANDALEKFASIQRDVWPELLRSLEGLRSYLEDPRPEDIDAGNPHI